MLASSIGTFNSEHRAFFYVQSLNNKLIALRMGAESLFWKPFRILYKSVCPKAGRYYAVDGSVLLYSISRAGLGWETFVADPQDAPAMDALAEKWANAMMTMLRVITDRIPKECMTIFLEGRVTKARHLKQTRGRIGRLSKALKTMLKPCPEYAKSSNLKQGKDGVSAAFGRPDWQLTLLIAQKLEQNGFIVDASKDEEADWRICEWASQKAKSGAEVTVISVDSDYLALSPPGAIHSLAMPDQDNPQNLILIAKSDLLESCRLTELQLLIAFCIAGTDNVISHIGGIGWANAVKYVQAHIPDSWTIDDFLNANGLDRLPGLIKWKNATNELVIGLGDEIAAKIKQFRWVPSDSPMVVGFPVIYDEDIKSESYLHSFAFELCGTEEEQRLVRPAVAKLVMNSQFGYGRRDFESLKMLTVTTAPIKKKEKVPFVNDIPGKFKRGFLETLRKTSCNGRKNTFGISIPGVREMPFGKLITGPEFFPKWFGLIKTGKLADKIAENGMIIITSSVTALTNVYIQARRRQERGVKVFCIAFASKNNQNIRYCAFVAKESKNIQTLKSTYML